MYGSFRSGKTNLSRKETIVIEIIFSLSLLGILSTFVLYPIWIFFLTLVLKNKSIQKNKITPTVSIIIVMCEDYHLLSEKLNNLLLLEYPTQLIDIIICIDGSITPQSKALIDKYPYNIVLVENKDHIGKNKSLNKAVQFAQGEILVFTDADAMLAPDSINTLVANFADKNIGGVCGEIQIVHNPIKAGKIEKGEISKAQHHYFSFDKWLKSLENKYGNISSNMGTLYAIRHELFQPILPTATDDLYNALSIILQNKRFVFESEAKLWIERPSSNAAHEIERRRRIVCCSLVGIFSRPQLLNPAYFGFFSINLLLNKVVRRLLPFFLISLFISNIIMLNRYVAVDILFIMQCIFYFLAIMYYAVFSVFFKSHFFLMRLFSVIFYFCIGNIGTLIGVIDFLRGKRIEKWVPVKKSPL